MCGIAGFVSFDRDNGRPEWAAIAHVMGETLAHRGPNDKGLWQGPHCVLAHRRLAVIDPERGHQPMVKRRGDAEFAIVYNGELYNAASLRRALEGVGHVFETDSDTEVLLCAYLEYGEEVGARLEGL